jgi:hypothetical protein
MDLKDFKQIYYQISIIKYFDNVLELIIQNVLNCEGNISIEYILVKVSMV